MQEDNVVNFFSKPEFSEPCMFARLTINNIFFFIKFFSMFSDPLISKHSLHIIFLFRSFHMYGHLHACREYAVTKVCKIQNNVQACSCLACSSISFLMKTNPTQKINCVHSIRLFVTYTYLLFCILTWKLASEILQVFIGEDVVPCKYIMQ